MKNTISQRVADFLNRFPPFNSLSTDELEQIATQISIVYKEKGALLFEENQASKDHFFVVHKGAVALRKTATNTIVDICDEGDIFGLRPLMAQEAYKMEAKAQEESILYTIPIAVFKPFVLSNMEVGNFLLESFASNTRNPYTKTHRGTLYGEATQTESEISNSSKLLDVQTVKYSKKLVSCDAKTTVKEIAEMMSKRRVGAMLVVQNKLPIGIITDKDLRNKIVTGIFPITATASQVMSTPVITYPKKLTVTQAQMAMMKSNISHLCLTKDGTPNTKVVGMLSKHDIMVSLGNNPAAIIKAIKRTKKFKEVKILRKSIMSLLQGYLDQNIPMTITSKIITELNDVCIKQIIKIALEKIETPPPVSFAWLSIGSQGRSEQLLQTDQDNALIYEDVPEPKNEETKAYFLALAKIVTKGLLTIGYEYCPAEMMASNPKWCLSLTNWKKLTAFWIANPGKEEVLLSSTFFDFNLTYGESKLTEALSDAIFEQVKIHPTFFVHLASGALQNASPTGFFRQFLVEQNGAHKDFFDLKRRALMPLIEGARVLILSHSVKGINNTAERFEKLASLEPNNEELYLACSYASKALTKFRTKQGLLHSDSGRFIELNTLTKEEKIKLKRTFKTIKELQDLLNIRFQVTQLIR